MDRRLLDYYNTELQHIRQMAGEFGREFPKIAGRLALDMDGREICPDPFVERLLEGFAFMAARVRLKLDAEFPRFTQSLLETVYPHYLAPTPSMAIVRFDPDPQEGGLADGYVLPRGTALRSFLGRGERTACEFRTAHQVTLWPLQMTEARYYTRDVGELDIPSHLRPKAALRLRFKTTAGVPVRQLGMDQLDVFLRGTDETPGRIYEQLASRLMAVAVQSGVKPKLQKTLLPAENVRPGGFAEEEALLPRSPRSFEGYRLLREYFSFPQRFLFSSVRGLNPALRRSEGDQFDVIFFLKEDEPRLEGRVGEGSFSLFCTPAINLFSRQSDRLSLSERFSEFQVVVDRTRPLDFEIFEIERATGYGTRADETQEFRPFYRTREGDRDAGAFYTVNRIPRLLTAREKQFGKHSSYTGTEVYVSLVDANAAPFRTDLKELGFRVLCTNRHLPIQMPVNVGPADFSMDVGAPVTGVKCLAGPTLPLPSHAEGNLSWKLISHFSLNYLSLLDGPEADGALALREMLKLYSVGAEAHARRQIEGLLSVKSAPILRRVTTSGPLFFARGLEVRVLFDELGFEGAGVFVLGSVLEQFFAKYVSLNSFTETVIATKQRGEIMRWPARIGKRPLT